MKRREKRGNISASLDSQKCKRERKSERRRRDRDRARERRNKTNQLTSPTGSGETLGHHCGHGPRAGVGGFAWPRGPARSSPPISELLRAAAAAWGFFPIFATTTRPKQTGGNGSCSTGRHRAGEPRPEGLWGSHAPQPQPSAGSLSIPGGVNPA